MDATHLAAMDAAQRANVQNFLQLFESKFGHLVAAPAPAESADQVDEEDEDDEQDEEDEQDEQDEIAQKNEKKEDAGDDEMVNEKEDEGRDVDVDDENGRAAQAQVAVDAEASAEQVNADGAITAIVSVGTDDSGGEFVLEAAHVHSDVYDADVSEQQEEQVLAEGEAATAIAIPTAAVAELSQSPADNQDDIDMAASAESAAVESEDTAASTEAQLDSAPAADTVSPNDALALSSDEATTGITSGAETGVENTGIDAPDAPIANADSAAVVEESVAEARMEEC